MQIQLQRGLGCSLREETRRAPLFWKLPVILVFAAAHTCTHIYSQSRTASPQDLERIFFYKKKTTNRLPVVLISLWCCGWLVSWLLGNLLTRSPLFLAVSLRSTRDSDVVLCSFPHRFTDIETGLWFSFSSSLIWFSPTVEKSMVNRRSSSQCRVDSWMSKDRTHCLPVKNANSFEENI